MKIRDAIVYFVATGIGFFGLIIVLGALLNLGRGDETVPAIALGIGLGVAPLVFAVWLVRHTHRGSRRRRREELERHVLDLAARSGGRLTPTQVAQSTRLTLKESKAFLDGLHVDGHCRSELGDDGSFFYRFDA